MFLKKSYAMQQYDELATELAKSLQQTQQAPIVAIQAKQEKAVQHLLQAAEILEDLGFTKQAIGITEILERFAWEVPSTDPATSGLTPEKMVANLEQTGWVFNADDGEVLEVTDDNMVADPATVTTNPDGMAINPMNPINPGGMTSIAFIKN